MATIASILLMALACAIADHRSGTAWYQQGDTMFNDDHFDIFADDDNRSDLPLGLVALEDAGIGFAILSDSDLAAIDAEIDEWPDYDEYLASDEDVAIMLGAYAFGDYETPDYYEV